MCVTLRARGAFNVADPVTPSVRDVAAAIARRMGHHFDIFAGPVGIGHTPWSVPRPMRLSCDRAQSLGWDGGPDYSDCLPAYTDWKVAQAKDWREAFPGF